MRPQISLTLALLFWVLGAQAQVKFKVKLLSDNVTYQVLLKPEATWNPPFNSVPSAQITFRVPTGGFQVGTVTNHAGTWSNNATIVAPPENPGYDYIVFGLQGATNAISFQKGVEVPIFSFKNNGNCPGALELIKHSDPRDPFMPPNSQSINVGNQISVAGAGLGVNAYTGNYNAISADCRPSSDCGIEVYDVELNSPTACGVADGSIIITATNSNGLPLQYSINNGQSFQSSKTFSNLAAGNVFQIIVRDIAAICIVNVGSFELEGPLAAAVTGVDLVNPSCGGSDGSITVHAFSETGSPLEYGINNPTTWQSSNVFNGLAAGSYQLFVKDLVKNCESPVGVYTLEDCPPEDCKITYELEYLGSGLYQVNLLSGVSYNAPNNVTASAQVTIKVPTGGFQLANLTMQTPNVNFAVSSTHTAPAEDPAHDYITIGLTSTNTQDIPYADGGTVHLFTFENEGACTGDSIFLMNNNDPFFPPNGAGANVGQQLSVNGYGGAVPVCIAGSGAAVCDNNEPPCIAGFQIEQQPSGTFIVSMTPDTTWTFPNNITSSAQWTIKVPTGGFTVSNLTSLLPNVSFSIASTYAAPPEDPQHDYISFILASPGTQGIPYAKGVKTQLFSFENTGACTGGAVFLMDNATDPFFPPNSQSANVGQQLTVSGYGGADAPICVEGSPVQDCAPCTSTVDAGANVSICGGASTQLNATSSGPGTFSWSPSNGLSCTNCANPTANPANTTTYTVTFTDADGCASSDDVTVTIKPAPVASFLADDGCVNNPVDFTNTTTSIGTISSWNWDFGDGSPASTQESPSHAFSSSGNFEVSLTVTTVDACSSSFSDFVTVFPGPGQPPVGAYSICAGESVQLQSPNGVSSAVWSPTIGLSNPNIPNPIAQPPSSVNYSVVYTNANGCTSSGQVSVFVSNKPVISEVNVGFQSDCNVTDGEIEIIISGVGNFQYSINNGVNWQNNKRFTGLAAGSYNVYVRNSNGTCPVPFDFNPVIIEGPVSPNIISVTPSQPVGCQSNGGIVINAAGGSPPLRYSINGGASFQNSHIFTGLAGGTYQVVVANSDESCHVASPSPVVLNQATPPTILTPVADFSLCEGTGATVSIQLSQVIQSYTITSNGSYSNESLTGSTLSFDVTPSASASNYAVVLTATNGCTATEIFQLQQLPLPVASFNTSLPACKDGQVTLEFTGTASPSSTLTWALSGGQVISSSPATGTAPAGATTVVTWSTEGAKNVVLTVDQAGCQDNISTEIDINPYDPDLTLTTTQLTTCGGSDGAISLVINDTCTYSFNWVGPGAFNSSSQDLTNLSSGTYQVTITETESLCTATATSTIEELTANFNISITSTDPTCSGDDGTITLTGSPTGATFNWQGPNGSNLPATSTQNNLAGGAYSVTVTATNGCTATYNATLTQVNPPQVSISGTTGATCGQANGGFNFTVTGGNNFSYKILNGSVDNFGSPGQQIPVTGIQSGAYVLEVKDLVTNCVVLTPFTIDGTNPPQVSTMTTTPSACGIEDASVCAVITGGAAPYTLTSDKGIPPGFPFNGEGCVQGLYEGDVTITVTDAAGCSTELIVTLPDQPGISLSAEDLTVTQINCPGGFGTILSNTGNQCSIYDANNQLFGITPLMQVPSGNYMAIYSEGNCTAELPIVINSGPTEWAVNTIKIPESCTENDGQITLAVTGANGGYSYNWSTGDTSLSVAGLTSTASYSVTISDNKGCTTTLRDLKVDLECSPCVDAFYVDTFKVVKQGPLTEVCLPTYLPNLDSLELQLNGQPYTAPVEDCVDSTVFYGYGSLLNLGQPPYRLDSWVKNGQTVPGFVFNTIGQLVDYMNQADPAGNWIVNTMGSSIVGGAPGNSYGSLIVTHIASNTTLTMQINTLSVGHPSIFINEDSTHVFIVRNPVNNCADTLYINVLEPELTQTIDSIQVEVPIGGMEMVCIPTNQLPGTPQTLNNDCISITNNAQVVSTGNTCIEVHGMSEGPDKACIVICDDRGVCDTTYLFIVVKDTSTDIVIYNGFSPNEDGVNDYFRIKNIELYPDNTLLIFNRWGNKIFERERYTNADPWKAIWRNTYLSDGSYFYILDVKMKGEKKRFSGYVEVRK